MTALLNINDKDNAIVSARDSAMPVLIPQPRGGALLSGGVPGHVGGPGRAPSAIRASMRQKLDEKVLDDLMAKYAAEKVDALGLANFLAKFGLGEKTELTVVSQEVVAKLEETVDLMRTREEWRTEDFLDAMRPIWR